MKYALAILLLIIGCNCRTTGPARIDIGERATYPVQLGELGACTAFHVSDVTWVTAGHCALFYAAMDLSIDGHPVTEASVHPDPTVDLGLLVVPGTEDYPKLQLGHSPRIGTRVTVYGFPYFDTIHTVPQAGLTGKVSGHEFEVSVFADGGLSGAPVLDSDGRVVGVVSSSFRGRPYTYAVGVDRLREIL